MATASVLDVIDPRIWKAAREGLRPIEQLSVRRWADTYRVIAENTSELPGKWKTSNAPYLAGPMDALDESKAEVVALMWGSQLGKTEIAFNWLFRNIHQRPRPFFAVLPNEPLARKFIDNRLLPAMRAMPEILARRRSNSDPNSSKRADFKALEFRFDGMTVYWSGSHSAANLEGISVADLWVEELDTGGFDPEAMGKARERQKGYTERKILITSKPSRRGMGMHAIYESGSRERFYVPCLKCNAFQVLKFENLKWEGGKTADPDEVEKHAWYECPECKRRHESREKMAMLSGGVWCREGQKPVSDSGGGVKITGKAEYEGQARRTFHLSSLYSAVLKFGYVAKKFLSHGGKATPGWVNGDLAEPWEEDGDTAEANEVRRLCVSVSQDGAGYELVTSEPPSSQLIIGRRMLPMPVVSLIAGVDLQRDRAYVEIRGFSANAADSYLVWFGSVAVRAEDHDLKALDFLTTLSFPHPRGANAGGGGVNLRLSAGGIDSGEGMRTYDVYRWVNRQGNGWFATKGRWGAQMATAFVRKNHDWEVDAKERPDEVRKRLAMQGKTPLIEINTDHYKGSIYSRLRMAPPTRIDERCGRLYFPAWEGGLTPDGRQVDRHGLGEYIEQLTSEKLVPEAINSGWGEGRTRMKWLPKPGRAGKNHHLDTCVITMAVADVWGVATVSKERFDQYVNGLLAKQQQQKQTPAR